MSPLRPPHLLPAPLPVFNLNTSDVVAGAIGGGEFERTVLPNGLRVITSTMPHTYAVSSVLIVGAGSRYETDEHAGVSHLFEHMLFKGTPKRPKPRDISGEIESVGGTINAYTDREFTGYWCKMALTHYRRGIDVLADIVQNPLFRANDISQEKHVVLEEIRAAHDSPAATTSMLLDSTMWPDQPLGRDVAGSEETVNSITRDEMLAYHDKQYVGGNMVLAVAGNVEHGDIVDQAAETLGGLHSGEPSEMYGYEDNLRGPAVGIQFRDLEQLHIAMAFEGVDVRDPRRHALRLMSIVLGGSMSSRLFEEVRENRGLVYSIGSSVMSLTDCGVLDIDTAVEPALADEALRVILDELIKMRQGVTESELHDARELAKGRLLLGMEESRAVANSLAAQDMQSDRISTLAERIAHYDAVTLDDVRSVANDVITPDKLAMAAVGPVRESEPYAQLLSF